MLMIDFGKGATVLGFLRFLSSYLVACVAIDRLTQRFRRQALKRYTATLFSIRGWQLLESPCHFKHARKKLLDFRFCKVYNLNVIVKAS